MNRTQWQEAADLWTMPTGSSCKSAYMHPVRSITQPEG